MSVWSKSTAYAMRKEFRLKTAGQKQAVKADSSKPQEPLPDTPAVHDAASDRLPKRRQLTLHLDTIPEAVIITAPDGKVTDLNMPAARMLNLGSEEVMRRNIMTLLPGLSQSVLAWVVDSLRAGRSVVLEGLDQNRIHEKLSAEISVSLCGIAGEELCFVLRDTQYYRQTEEALLRMRKRFARAERLEAAGTASGQIAHDFNNLLTPMLAYPSLIRRELDENSPALEYLNVMEKTAEDMAHMTQQLLALSRRGTVGKEIFNNNNIIERVFALLENDLPGANIVLEKDLACDLLPVRGSSDQLLRVIQNLCRNAIDAMGKEGRLNVRTENICLESPVGGYESVDPGEYVKVTISDTGSGIPAEIREKIFEPFFTTKRGDKRRGSGLGLSIVHGIVKDHMGYVDLDSKPGEGTSFYLYLPVCRSEEDKPVKTCKRGAGEKILVVDNDQNQLRIIRHLLETLNYKTTGVASGEEAIALLEKAPNAFDVVLMEMYLEGEMDGSDLWRAIDRMRPGIPSLLVSGFSIPMSRIKEAQRLGAGPFIKKPLTLQNLGDGIQRALSRQIPETQDNQPALSEKAAAQPTPDVTRVLLVDDEEPIRRMFAVIIAEEMPDIEILQAANGEEALKIFRQNPCDVIVMDLHMPIMDGRQAFVKLDAYCKAEKIPLPSVIFCTGFALPEFLKEIVSDSGPHTLLQKPVRPDVLVKTIQRLIPVS